MAEILCTPHNHSIADISSNLRQRLLRTTQTHFKEDDHQNKSLHINNTKLTTSWSDLFSTIPVTHLFSTIPKLQLPPPPADATTPATDKTFEVKLDDNEDELFETPSADNLPFRIGLPSPEDASYRPSFGSRTITSRTTTTREPSE
jgi:hypothetical protein